MPKQYLDKIRQKYPQYNDLPDSTLAANILKKYPQYQDVLGDMVGGSAPPPQKSEPSFLGQLGQIQIAPYQKMGQAIQQSLEGNPLAGGLNIFNASMQEAMTPISSLDLAVRQIPVVGQPLSDVARMVGSIPQKIGEAAVQPLMPLAEKAANFLSPRKELSPEQQQQTRQSVSETAGNVAPFAMGAALKPLGVPIENMASRLAGKAFGAGENFLRTQQLGKFAQEHGITLGEKGYNAAKGLAQHLNDEINQKIIDPATQSGATINANEYIQKLRDFRTTLNNRAVPDRASLMAVDRMIQSATDRASKTGGQIPIDEAQKMKVENNQILHEVYKNMASGGNITERGTAKKAGLVQVTDDIRTQLEQIHPELKNVNWNEGQALELKGAIYDYLNRIARGEGATNIVARGGVGKVATLSLYDILKVKPIESRLAVVLGKVGRALSGNRPDIVTGVNQPFQPPTVRGLLPRGTIELGMEQPSSGIRSGGPPFTQTGNRLLPPPSVTIPPEYMSTGAQKADVLRTQPPYQTGENVPGQLPDIVQRAKMQAESGQTITIAQANLIRQFLPEEADAILSKIKRTKR